MSNSVVDARSRKPMTLEETKEVLEKRGCLKSINSIPKTAEELSGRIEDLPVDTPSLINRDTTSKALAKILEASGGIDGKKWQPPKVGRVKGTGEMWIYDGDHSRAIFLLQNPEATTMPMNVIEVDDTSEIHGLFVNTNATGRTPITAEQIYVHKYHSGDEECIKLASALEECDLRIYCSHEKGGSVGSQSGYLTKSGGFKRSLKAVGEDTLAEAVKFLGKCLEENSQSWQPCRDFLPAEMAGALGMMFESYPEFLYDKDLNQNLYNYFGSEFAFKKPKRVAEFLKNYCSSITNYAEYSIAAGLVKLINQETENFGLKRKLSISPLNKRFKKLSLTAK